jgi:hypothetical protein
MKLAVSARGKRYARRFGIAGAIVGFLPLGLRAVMMAGDFFIDSPDRSDAGGMIFWAMAILIGALFQAAVAGAVGAVIGIGVAFIVDRKTKTEWSPPLLLSGLSQRAKSWGMWGCIIFAVCGILAGTYQMVWPIPELQDPRVEALPLAARIPAYALTFVKAIVLDGMFGWVFGAGAAAIVNRIRGAPRIPMT